MTRLNLAAVVLAGVALGVTAACGAPEAEAPVSVTSKAGTSSTSVVASPSVAPKSATPTVLTREQAAKRYLEIVTPSNNVHQEPKCKQVAEFYVDGGSWPPENQPTWDERPHKVMAECYKRLVPLYEKQLKGFQTTAWPADAKADMADLISLTQADLHCVKQIAKASSSSDAMYAAIECFASDDDSADRVRARFGLPGRADS